MRFIFLSFFLTFLVQGCTSPPQVVVDPRSVKNEAQYNKDMAECFSIAKGYDIGGKKVKNTTVGAVAGGGVVAGIAVAVSGAVFWPAVPFIVAGAALGGVTGNEITDSNETGSKEKIISECLKDRGYRAYSPS